MVHLNDLLEAKAFVLALAWTLPRTLGMFAVIPLFAKGVVPALLRSGVAASLGLVVAPTLSASVMAADMSAGQAVLTLLKELFVGFCLGCTIAVPFWAFEAVGFLIDNQRGASIASTLNPLTGHDSSPLGILFNQAFITFFFISGGFFLVLDMLYDSFRLWHVFSWFPTLRAESIPILISQIMRLTELALLLSSPVLVAMFLSEMGLALASRFVPQLQVFFLAMPIKSGLAFLVLVLYLKTFFDHGFVLVESLPASLDVLDDNWRHP